MTRDHRAPRPAVAHTRKHVINMTHISAVPTATPPAPPAPPAEVDRPGDGVWARLRPSQYGTTFQTELVEIWIGEVRHGVVALPRDAAHDFIRRLEEVPPALTAVTREVVGHVRYALDINYDVDADEPSPWMLDLISLIETGDEDRRLRLGRSYSDYVVCVCVALGPDGLETLARMHEQLPAAAPHTAQDG